jgi:hypothetical protein
MTTLGTGSTRWLVAVAGFQQNGIPRFESAIKSTIANVRFVHLPIPRSIVDSGYRSDYVKAISRDILNAVFNGETDKVGFCSSRGRKCKLAHPDRSDCRRRSDEVCEKRRVDFIVIFFSKLANYNLLIEECGSYAMLCEVQTFIHGEKAFPNRVVYDLLSTAKDVLFAIRQKIHVGTPSIRSPIALPLWNTRIPLLKRLLSSTRGDIRGYERVEAEFVATYGSRDQNQEYRFLDDRLCSFSPARKHGVARISEEDRIDPKFCLDTFYRAGSLYNESLHYDVTNDRGGPLRQRFTCAKRGDLFIADDHVNIYPNDLIRE